MWGNWVVFRSFSVWIYGRVQELESTPWRQILRHWPSGTHIKRGSPEHHHSALLVRKDAPVLCRFWLFTTPWVVAHQAPLSMGFSRQQYWGGLLCPPAGDLPELGIKPASLMFSALAGKFYTARATWEARWERYPSSNRSVPHHAFTDSTNDVEASSHLCLMLWL